MEIGNFKIIEPIPHLKAAHVIATLKPWIDCGSVGTLVLQRLEKQFGSRELARLAQPGSFYDFTRYRPITHFKGGVRQLTIPNTTISWARSDTGNDLVFLHLLEPHMQGEIYAGSVWQVLKKLGIQRYGLVGSFYDTVPHTRPLLISGGSSSRRSQVKLEKLGINQSRYEGPSTICNLISEDAEKAGVETMVLLVHLPQYTELEEDYMGMLALLQVLHSLYEITIHDTDTRLAETQMRGLEAAVEKDKKLKALVTQLEAEYDARMASSKDKEGPQLSREVDQFLREMENRFRDS